MTDGTQLGENIKKKWHHVASIIIMVSTDFGFIPFLIARSYTICLIIFHKRMLLIPGPRWVLFLHTQLFMLLPHSDQLVLHKLKSHPSVSEAHPTPTKTSAKKRPWGPTLLSLLRWLEGNFGAGNHRFYRYIEVFGYVSAPKFGALQLPVLHIFRWLTK